MVETQPGSLAAHAPGIVGPRCDYVREQMREQLLAAYADAALQGLLTCEIAPGLQELRQQTLGSRWLIVSGGDQAELRQVFAQRGLAHLFDGGIYGSPDTKEKILARELHTGNIRHPALYLGDSKYDHQAATAAGLDFLFLHGWSEVESWQEWLSVQKINGVSGMRELLGE